MGIGLGCHCGFLSFAQKFFRILAWAAVVLLIITSIVIFVGAGSPQTPRPMGLVVLLMAGVYFIAFTTISEIIKVLLKIDKNTEKSA